MLKIPKRLKKIVDKNPQLSGILMQTTHDYSQIIEHGEFEFFPDYTDHRIPHLNRVLETCDFLMTDKAYELLSPEDVTVLVMSILLHDIGMHITHEGLISLIKGDLKHQKIDQFDNSNWGESWESFFNEVRKFNEKNLINLFGSVLNVQEPPEDKESLTRNDRKLYGEFIRRTHPRLAHEIALYGFPLKDNNTLPFAPTLDNDLKELIGLVARSHGMDIRDTFDYLEKKFKQTWRSPRNVKVVYLMVLLRIADYLHITSERAPVTTLNTKNISSTVSKKEWDLHQSVREISTNLIDSESIYVDSYPESSEIFLKMKRLLTDIQKEIDTSWGILGEVYDGLQAFRELKIKIRRIYSNLDKVSEFSEDVNYLPRKITCECDPELLKLLIAPLYGDDITYGVRELLQNSVDACREMKVFFSKNNIKNDYKPEINIDISEEQGSYYFTIKDNGIGMDEEIIVNYFLKAGASFRNSSIWKNTFNDENNNSIVQRTGRFGVGIFAGFLIGEEMEVKTRRINSDNEFQFKVSMNQEQIEVIRSNGEIEKGTEIKIRLTDKILEKFKEQIELENSNSNVIWSSWFALKEPNINITIPDSWKDKRHLTNLFPAEKDLNFHTIFPKGFERIEWTYSLPTKFSLNNLICNGIWIPSGYRVRTFNFPSFNEADLPLILVSDYDGNMPLNLNRNQIHGKLPFEKELIEDICKDINAELLTMEVLEFDSNGFFNVVNHELNHKSLANRKYVYRPVNENELLLFKEGYCLVHSFNIEKLNLKRISKLWLESLKESAFSKEKHLTGLIISKEKINAIYDFKNVLEIDQIGTDVKYEVTDKRIILPKERFHFLMGKGRMKAGFRKGLKVEKEGKTLISVVQGNPEKSDFDFEHFDENSEGFTLYAEYELGEKIEFGDDRFDGYILEKINEHQYSNTKEPRIDVFSNIANNLYKENVLIPYNMIDRKKVCKYGFEKLNMYMNKYLNK